MYVHRMANHLISRNRTSFSVFRVRHAGIRQVESGIDLRRGVSGIRRIDIKSEIADILKQSCSVFLVRLLLHVLEIRSVKLLVFQAYFMRNEFYILPFRLDRFRFLFQEKRLRDIGYLVDFLAFRKGFCNLDIGDFSHPVNAHICMRINENARLQ